MNDIRPITQIPKAFRAFRAHSVFGKNARIGIARAFFLIALLALAGFLFLYVVPLQSIPFAPYRLIGTALIAFGIFLIFAISDFYYASLHVPAPFFAKGDQLYGADVTALDILMDSGFFEGGKFFASRIYGRLPQTMFGKILFMRLGIMFDAYSSFLAVPKIEVELDPVDFSSRIREMLEKRQRTLAGATEIMLALFDSDKIFSKFLFSLKIRREDLKGAGEWVEHVCEAYIKHERWWERENLSRTQGIGKDLGYGYTYTLDQYAHEITGDSIPFSRETRAQEVSLIEGALSRSYQANVMLVGDEGAGKHATIEGLAGRIRDGRIAPALEYKRVVVLDYQGVSAAAKEKSNYEGLLMKMFGEAVTAGNIILVIENFPGFLASSFGLGVDALGLIEPYISTARIQVIALSDRESFHRDLEPLGKVSKLFEKVEVGEPTPERAMRMLEDAAAIIEGRSGKIFTYRAVATAFSLADKYITEGAMPEKAVDLLDEVAQSIPKDRALIYLEDVERLVEKRTHIPTEQAGEEERKKLLNMEELLHTRMINQEHAIKLISDALRRARSGLKGGTRPIGTFLFLGPTGVGKTETAKALAEMYFGGTDSMIRFDMSEFQGEEGLQKLIGAYASKEVGALSKALREKPFSLLLFDEFEKASREVHNLFLQILDEGFFSDASGRRVSARETMIIATSNAGANIIWDYLQKGTDPATIQQIVIDEIRKAGVFTPELLNRFDAVVVYHPLKPDQLVKVAMLMLKELALRLSVNEIRFEPSESLARKVVEIGYDPIFGARPMRRAIADRVEQVIAKKILEGMLKRGDLFSFTQEDIDKL